MTEGPVYQWNTEAIKLALEKGEYGPGEYLSAVIWTDYIGFWEHFSLYVWVQEASGAAPSITASLDYTSDDVNELPEEEVTWVEAPTSTTVALTGPGSTAHNFQIPSADTYQRARIVIAGEDTSMTCRVMVGAIPVLENPPEWVLAARTGKSPAGI